ncbi:MAG: hypothetical protein WBL20_09055 [Sphingobium sp.]|uniref:hypothetical protein n=1 Tax=Sphingobium sp. TaxID=1912891 RepID=UPI002E232A29
MVATSALLAQMLTALALIASDAPATTSAPTIRAAIGFPLEDVVGPVRAGKLCLPNGKLTGSDFVTSPRDLQLLIEEVLAAKQSDERVKPVSEVRLTALQVKLCARSWGAFGIGRRPNLAGESRFSFELVGPDGTTTPVPVIITLDGKSAMTPDRIAHEAIRRLLIVSE